MKKTIYIKRIASIIVLLFVFIVVFVMASKILVPKFLYGEESKSPETEMWDAFYEEPENSIDVIFLGNSHVYCGVNPIVFYEKTGLTAYSLSTSGQDIATGYYLLREALKYQHPRYVVVDFGAFLNDEANLQRTIADMKLSKNKLEMIRSFEYTKEKDENRLGYYLSNIIPFNYYHSRWDDIGKGDFDYSDMVTAYNGYVRTRDKNGENPHSNFYNNDPTYVYSERTQEYFPRIKMLCEENDIELIISGVPFDEARSNDFICFVNYMAMYGLTPYDFNSSPVYESIGIDSIEDYRDSNHMNEYGAAKFTSFMADAIFADREYAAEHSDAIETVWEDKLTRWNHDTKNRDLLKIERLPEYLEAIKDPDYIALVAYNEDRESGGGYIFQDEVRELLSSSGCIITDTDIYTSSFSLILDGGNPVYDTKYNYDGDMIECKVDNEHCILAVNRQNYGQTDERLNIVLYSKSQKKVVDSCYFELINSLNVLRNE